MPDVSASCTPPVYQSLHAPDLLHLPVRDLRYGVRVWHGASRGPHPVLFMGHGWMDVAASFQFVVDAMQQRRTIVAPDWRGFGTSVTPAADHFVFADYLLDLDILIDHFSPTQPIDLLGHSMGGNIAYMYAGVRPERVRRLINVEGFGLPAAQPADSPLRLSGWMDGAKAARQGSLALNTYPNVLAVAQRLQKNNPRLPLHKALWLAQQWAAPDQAGVWHVRAHAAHKVPHALIYHVPDVLACLERITAPTLCVQARDDTIAQFWGERYSQAEYRSRMAHIANVRHAVVEDAGHMLHHDQPLVLARLVEDFLG